MVCYRRTVNREKHIVSKTDTLCWWRRESWQSTKTPKCPVGRQQETYLGALLAAFGAGIRRDNTKPTASFGVVGIRRRGRGPYRRARRRLRLRGRAGVRSGSLLGGAPRARVALPRRRVSFAILLHPVVCRNKRRAGQRREKLPRRLGGRLRRVWGLARGARASREGVSDETLDGKL